MSGLLKIRDADGNIIEIPAIVGPPGPGVDPEQIVAVVEDYLKENPPESVGVPSGGKAGQYLRKVSDDDGDVEWADMVIPQEYGLVTYDNTKTLTIT